MGIIVVKLTFEDVSFNTVFVGAAIAEILDNSMDEVACDTFVSVYLL